MARKEPKPENITVNADLSGLRRAQIEGGDPLRVAGTVGAGLLGLITGQFWLPAAIMSQIWGGRQLELDRLGAREENERLLEMSEEVFEETERRIDQYLREGETQAADELRRSQAEALDFLGTKTKELKDFAQTSGDATINKLTKRFDDVIAGHREREQAFAQTISGIETKITGHLADLQGGYGQLERSLQGRYDERRREVVELLDTLGESERKEIEKVFGESLGRAQQQAVDQGLGGTSLVAGLTIGSGVQKATALSSLEERLRRERAEFEVELQGEAIKSLERTGLTKLEAQGAGIDELARIGLFGAEGSARLSGDRLDTERFAATAIGAAEGDRDRMIGSILGGEIEAGTSIRSQYGLALGDLPARYGLARGDIFGRLGEARSRLYQDVDVPYPTSNELLSLSDTLVGVYGSKQAAKAAQPDTNWFDSLLGGAGSGLGAAAGSALAKPAAATAASWLPTFLFPSMKGVKNAHPAMDADQLDEYLRRLESLSIQEWSYKDPQPAIDSYFGQKHVGPFAEDFHEAFGLGDGESIHANDIASVALAAVKSLSAKVAYLEQSIAEMKSVGV